MHCSSTVGHENLQQGGKADDAPILMLSATAPHWYPCCPLESLPSTPFHLSSCQHGACAHHAEAGHDVVCSRGGLPPSRRAAGCASCHDSARSALTGGCHIACFHSSFCSAGQAGRAGRARSRRPATMWIIKANLAGPARPKSLPRLAEALGSPRYDLALRRASSEPAGRGVSQR